MQGEGTSKTTQLAKSQQLTHGAIIRDKKQKDLASVIQRHAIKQQMIHWANIHDKKQKDLASVIQRLQCMEAKIQTQEAKIQTLETTIHEILSAMQMQPS